MLIADLPFYAPRGCKGSAYFSLSLSLTHGAGSRDSRLLPIWAYCGLRDQTRIWLWDPGD